MSCISSNFSSFFLNSLNDSSEFAKYLSNGELRFSSFEDFQVFGSDTGSGTPPSPSSQSQPQSQSQLQLTAAQQAAASQQQQIHYYNGVSNGINNNVNLNAGANPTPLQSGGELYNGVVGQSNTIGNCESTNASSSAAASVTPAGVPQPSHQGVQPTLQQHVDHHLHPTHHTPSTHVTHSHQAHTHHAQHPYGGHASPHTSSGSLASNNAFHHNHHHAAAAVPPPPHLAHGLPSAATPNYPTTPQRWPTSTTATANGNPMVTASPGTPHTLSQLQSSANQPGTPIAPNPGGAQHFDGSFEFLKYLRHSNDYNAEGQGDGSGGGRATPQAGQTQSSGSSLIDLDSSTAHKSRSSRKAAALLSSVSRSSNSLDANTLDVFDHDSKHTIFDMQQVAATNSSNSNESSLEVSNLAFPSSHLNASNSNTSSEGAATGSSDFATLQTGTTASAPKPLATFTIKDNFDVHPSHKVEEGIFQHMNKLPAKKKENLKQLGVRFTGQMTLSDKSIVVDNFVKFCQEYDVQDHRPFLSLNQSGLNKADQIKFARYLGQGLPTFTLFCIYSNFKNLFCTKRTEIYTKDGYNLPYILDKTKRFLSNTTAGNTPNKSNPNASHPQSQATPTAQATPTQLQSQPQSSQTQPQLTPQPQQQTQPQQHPLPPQVQSQPLPHSLQPQPQPLPHPLHSHPVQPQPHPHQQSLQPQPHTLHSHPVQSQPLQPQPPKPPQTQPTHLIMQQTAPQPPIPQPPTNHLQQLQQHTVHIPMQISRGLPK